VGCNQLHAPESRSVFAQPVAETMFAWVTPDGSFLLILSLVRDS
jgi:hypothetical protein